ncbi:MAG: RDD family protein [Anaeroplasmataceae bacterium]|nr:RDD family protein [Anaeroplasmataceae bacterium]MDE6240952.1 RDD family protein [Anaeroplasmataceae bacterium]
MKYLNARSSQRFIAYLIDYILISLLVSFVLCFIPVYNQSADAVRDYYKAFLEGTVPNDISELTNVLKHAGIVLGLKLLLEIPVYALYLVVLPYFWEKQTLGRWAMHLRVISKDESKAKLTNLLLREMVGGLILLNLLSSSIVIPILFWYFSSTTGRSLADMIGGTRLIDDRFINQDFLGDDAIFEEKDYVDASFTEIKEEPKEEPAEEDTEYKVF